MVVEYPISSSLPAVPGATIRLFLAESIAAVIEVKSNVSAQWQEVERTAAQLAPLRRSLTGASLIMGTNVHRPSAQIPLFVAGYTGWKSTDTLQNHLLQCSDVAGILVLVIDVGLFCFIEAVQQYHWHRPLGTLGFDFCAAQDHEFGTRRIHESFRVLPTLEAARNELE